MASRSELVEFMIELEQDPTGKTIEEMIEEVKKIADRKFNKKYRVSWNNALEGLRYFLMNEYDYIMKDKDGNLVDYKGRRIKK